MTSWYAAKLGCTLKQASLALLASQGQPYRQLARDLGCSETATQERLRRLYKKVGVKNRVQLSYLIGTLS